MANRWHTHQDRGGLNSQGRSRRVLGNDGRHIATLLAPGDVAVELANVALITAAPDLLEALKRIVDVTEGIFEPDLVFALAAIAKAHSGAPEGGH